jgi:hypothetical protein
MIIPITSQSELNKYYQYHGGGWHEMPKYPARTFTGSAITATRFKAFTKIQLRAAMLARNLFLRTGNIQTLLVKV